MGRSKQMGKPVKELTPHELQTELVRCKTLIQIYPEKTAKGLHKRLRDIERRLNESISD